MLTFSILCEDVVLRKDIGGGIGGQTGRYLGLTGGALGGGFLGLGALGPLGVPLGVLAGMGVGASAGGQIGKVIGRNVISDPEGSADFSKPSHRVGYLAKPNTDAAGAAIDLFTFGTGAPVYGGIRNAIADDGAKRLGYDNIGRAAQGVSGFIPYVNDFAPLMGVFTPNKITKNK